ncbi:uncharacterized protein si:ch211-256a21.4 isoform X2 [Heptranchias perlo]|uniref:uncharacterized protein si:ch211-256a21.4 isoform X2 n=1 Tax=Heptranchias perlo TaxID=212740 RepID=UPI003559424F
MEMFRRFLVLGENLRLSSYFTSLVSRSSTRSCFPGTVGHSPSMIHCQIALCRLMGNRSAVEVERIFGMIASMMAVTAVCICLLLIFCWDPDNYSESKMNPGRVLHPGELLLVVLVPTALLFLISWSLFTNRHKKQIKNISQLGSGYWMGMCSWFTLLVILPIIYLMEQCSLPESEILT